MRRMVSEKPCPYGLDGLTARVKNILIIELKKPYRYRSDVLDGDVEKISVDEILKIMPLRQGIPNFGKVSRLELHNWLAARKRLCAG